MTAIQFPLLPPSPSGDCGSQIDALIAAGALFVCNHSGGKDSQAMLIGLLERIPREQLVVVHASLGRMEWPGALELAQGQAGVAGIPFLVARAKKTLLEMVERRFVSRPEVPSWPSASARQCTSDLKRDPIAREMRHYARLRAISTIVNCLGLRAEESPKRAKRIPFRRNARESNSVCTWYEWLPVHALTEEEVFATIHAAGQQPHFAYGLGNKRLSCMFCFLACKGDLENAAEYNPALLGEYIELEERTGYYFHQSGRPLKELVSMPVP